METPEWILYVKAGCPWCLEAVDYLDKHGYKYQQIDVRRDAAAFQEMKELSGQSLTPTLSIGDTLVLPDFDTGQLENFLSKHGLKPA